MSIVEKAQALRQAIKDEFGVTTEIRISIHDGPTNPGLTRELANYITCEIASQIDPEEVIDFYNDSFQGQWWVKLWVEGMAITAFYDYPGVDV